MNPQSATFSGCACANAWMMPSLTSVQIYQGAQTRCNPSYSSNGPWAEVSSIANLPDWYDIVPDCSKWLGDNSANPTPGNNPCSGFPVTGTYTASRLSSQEADALGQADNMCVCSNRDPKYTTNWFGDCPSNSLTTFKGTSTLG